MTWKITIVLCNKNTRFIFLNHGILDNIHDMHMTEKGNFLSYALRSRLGHRCPTAPASFSSLTESYRWRCLGLVWYGGWQDVCPVFILASLFLLELKWLKYICTFTDYTLLGGRSRPAIYIHFPKKTIRIWYGGNSNTNRTALINRQRL